MRSRWGSHALICLLVLGFAGCAHKKPPPPPPPKPKPVPKGDLLRFKYKEGEAPKANVKLIVEQEQAGKPGAKGGGVKVAFTVMFSEEEHVDVVSPDGTAQISARLVDADGTAGTGAKKDMVDDFALALDELKIQFKRSPRGEVSALIFSGLRKPLEEATARAIFNAIYAAGRGPVFPDDPIDVGGTWKGSTPLPPSSGLAGDVAFEYTYKGKDGTVATITCEGTLDGKGTQGAVQLHLAGKSSNELKLDLDAGKLLSNTFDGSTQTETGATGQPLQPAVKQHLHVEWSAPPIAAAASATPEPQAQPQPSGKDADEAPTPAPAPAAKPAAKPTKK
ncbi:MAG TPA: hypothetical protein VFF06_21835 [Polyangia bacterium]|nr:hypothetical protein [Polyangia bacterium]